jgi:hypothetical protein
MPDAQGNYLGDQATVLPDNTQNIIHYADQYRASNERRMIMRQREQQAADKRQADFYKQVGDNFNQSDYTDQNPYTEGTNNDIAATKAKYYSALSKANKSGTPIDEGQFNAAMTGDTRRIATNYAIANQKQQEIKDAVASYSKEPGIDHDKLLSLSMHDYFNQTDPKTGKPVMDASKWDRNLSGADIAKQALEKHYDILSNNIGVDDAMRKDFTDKSGADISQKSHTNPDGSIVNGYTGKIHPYQELYQDEVGQVKTRMRQEPVMVPGGKQLMDAKGNPVFAPAQDIVDKALASPGIATWAKSAFRNKVQQTNEQITEQNDRNKELGIPPIAMVEPDSPQGQLILRNLVGDKIKSNMPDNQPIYDDKSQQQFENNRKIMSDNRADQRMAQTDRRIADQENKTNAILAGKNAAPINDVYGKLDNIITESSPEKGLLKVNALPQDIQAEAMKAATSYDKDIKPSDIYIKKTASGDIFLMKGDPDNILNTDTHITQFTPTATNLLGKGNTGKAQKEAILANDKKPNMIQRGIQKVKDAVTGKGKTTIAKGSL